jgi:nucleoside-diphosphate-sugar epimerase
MSISILRMNHDWIVGADAPILITGAAGFIGAKVAETLLSYGFQDVRCLARPSSNLDYLSKLRANGAGERIKIVHGNLLSLADCQAVCEGVVLVYHLAAGSEKSFSGTFLNSVVTTRNLIEAVAPQPGFKRFVNVSSFAVYSNFTLGRSATLDESCPLENDPVGRFDPYCYGKLRQDEMVFKYGRERRLPYVILRPGAVYGPRARTGLHGRIGIDTFGFFLHLGGGNRVAFTYVDNCAEAIVLAGLVKGIEGEVFNIMDDELPTSRQFLRAFKRFAHDFRSFYVPYPVFYGFSWLWERYAKASSGQLPPAFNRKRCVMYYRSNHYSNAKAKRLLGWQPKVGLEEGLMRHCEYFKSKGKAN